jgi:WhiB family redox-sensing transcriptional regulator
MSRDTGAPDWRVFALCAQTGPELWFPEPGVGGAVTAAAKRICGRCEVRNECLEEGIETHPSAGIWGGCTTTELRAFRRRRGKEVAHRDDLTA